MSGYYFMDGVGDEVVVLLGILMAVFVVVVSWMSTRVDGSSLATDDLLRQTSTQADADQSEDRQPLQENLTPNATRENREAASQQSNEDIATQNTESLANPAGEDLAPSGIADTSTGLRQRVLQNPGAPEIDSSSPPQPSETLPQSGASTVSIRLKFMDETIQTVQASPDETLESFRRRNLPTETENRYRLIYGGQVLREGHRTLRELNLARDTTEDSPVVHCFLSPTVFSGAGGNLASSASQQMQLVADELRIGALLLPMLGLCLLCMWYLCIFHTNLFSIQSIVSIVGFTFLYISLVVNQFW